MSAVDLKIRVDIGMKLNLGFAAEDFDDWQNRIEGLVKAKGVHELLTDYQDRDP
jgi:hypothetical protein